MSQSPTPLTPPQPRSYVLAAPNLVDTPRLARNHVADVLRHAGLAGLVDTARLLVSEAVTNVFQHTAVSRLVVHTTVWPGRVLVSVKDRAPLRAPERSGLAAGSTAECGRGLDLLAALAAGWGINWYGAPEPAAKSVWFTLVVDGGDAGA